MEMPRYEAPSGVFWSVDRHGAMIDERWGTGERTQSRVHKLASESDAQMKVAELIAMRAAHGYVEVGEPTEPPPPPVVAEPPRAEIEEPPVPELPAPPATPRTFRRLERGFPDFIELE